jgi:molecular chaperone GrpE
MGNIEVKTSEEVEQREGEVSEVARDDAPERPREKGKKRKTKSAEEMTKQELMERLTDIEQKAKENHELYMRTYAEMENIKKRGIREREELAKFANESLIKEILPVIDNLRKALSHAQDDNNSEGLVEGIELTLNGLMNTLGKAGLTEVEAVGKPFDPHFHEAVSKQPDDTVPSNHVMMELQKGYLLNGRLIRPSMVVISDGSSNANEHEDIGA